jgi:predicted Zn finger-like uncharacterized protein
MKVNCEECGKKYWIDSADIKGKGVWFRCKACNHITIISKSRITPATDAAAAPTPEQKQRSESNSITTSPSSSTAREADGPQLVGSDSAAGGNRRRSRPKRRYTSLITKFLLFLVLPFVVIYGIIIFLTIAKMGDMSRIMVDKSSIAVMDVVRSSIKEKARSVARQTRQYLFTNLDLKKEAFNRDVYFKKVAVQKIGENGYTALYEMPEEGGEWRMWAHIDPKVVGVNMASFKTTMGSNFDDFWRIIRGVHGGKESEGIYTSEDIDGKMRPKLMFCSPIEGTPYVIAAVAYVGEFIAPVKNIQTKMRELTGNTTIWAIIMMAIGLILNAVVIFIYGRGITGRIIYLSDVADRISVGELDAEIDLKSNDEIGELSEAIARMQSSLNISIQRMRKRR